MRGHFFIDGDVVAELNFDVCGAIYYTRGNDQTEVPFCAPDPLSLLVALSVKLNEAREFEPDPDCPDRHIGALHLEGIAAIEYDFLEGGARSVLVSDKEWEVWDTDTMTLLYHTFRMLTDTEIFESKKELYLTAES